LPRARSNDFLPQSRRRADRFRQVGDEGFTLDANLLFFQSFVMISSIEIYYSTSSGGLARSFHGALAGRPAHFPPARPVR
jgi:hypothetical protein